MSFNFGAERKPKKILLIQTANPALTDICLDRLLEMYPDLPIVFFQQKGMERFLKKRDGVRVIKNEGGGLAGRLSRIRRERCDCVFKIASGEAGFWKLEVLPYLLFPKQIWNFDHQAMAVRFRLSGLLKLPTGGTGKSRVQLLRKALAPILFLFFAVDYFLNRKSR